MLIWYFAYTHTGCIGSCDGKNGKHGVETREDREDNGHDLKHVEDIKLKMQSKRPDRWSSGTTIHVSFYIRSAAQKMV